MTTMTRHPAMAPKDLKPGDVILARSGQWPPLQDFTGWEVHSTLKEDSQRSITERDGQWIVWLIPNKTSSFRDMFTEGKETPTGIIIDAGETLTIEREDA